MLRPSDCHCPDWPCCGCGHEPSQEEQAEMYDELHDDYDADWEDDEDYDDEAPEDQFRDDVEADADTLRSAGYGTDEDYGYYGDGEDFYGDY